MITLRNGGLMVQHAGELPDVPDGCVLYGDHETTSRNKKLMSINPWRNCWTLGFACTFNDDPRAWWVPRRILETTSFYADCMRKCSVWVNHNIKYDMHVGKNDLGIDPARKVLCTLARANVIDSDRHFKGGYGLDALGEAWLGIGDLYKMHETKFAPYLKDSKDYGDVPEDILAEYACDDIFTNRKLDLYLDEALPIESEMVALNECEVTRVLYKIEQRGLCVDMCELMQKEIDIYVKLDELDKNLTKLVSRHFRPGSNDDCFDVLCNQYGMPVLKWTDGSDGIEGSKPSFDQDALKQYLSHPFAPHAIVKSILAYRKLDGLNSKYVRPFQAHQINGRIHGTYNQNKTTGRSSCSDPNLHAMSKEAKSLFHPEPDCAFVSTDLSQIEFRFIVHYINNQKCIDDYHANPDLDYHEWVAEMCGIARDPAKTTNFRMGYGGGKAGLAKALSTDMQLVGHLGEMVAHLPECDREVAFKKLAIGLAENVYDSYHMTLPELKRTSYYAADVCRSRGHVRNLYGRRRYLPLNWAHKAFNNLCQSSAADMFKEQIVALDTFCEEYAPEAYLVAQTHDEPLLHMPTDLAFDPEFIGKLVEIMETPRIPLRVPVRCAVGISTKNWLYASKNSAHWPKSSSPWRLDELGDKKWDISPKQTAHELLQDALSST